MDTMYESAIGYISVLELCAAKPAIVQDISVWEFRCAVCSAV